MVDSTKWFWSCKINQPASIKRHRTLTTAAMRAGNSGFVYCEHSKSVYQIFIVSKRRIDAVDVDRAPDRCNTGGFDILEALRRFNKIE